MARVEQAGRVVSFGRDPAGRVATRADTATRLGGQYGWLGGAQRPADVPGGLLRAGVRLYAPGLGRFLQPDPQPGGSSSNYDYACADPVNNLDLDGKARLVGGGDCGAGGSVDGGKVPRE